MSSSVRYKVVGIGYRYSIFNSTWPLSLTLLKLMVVNNLLLDHVGLPQVVMLLSTWSFFAGWVERILLRQFY